jgi:hypothetical protein
MPSLHKSFVPNEILTADDINATCNPTTADHMPYAMAAGRVGIVINGSSASATINFPPGRFTAAPLIFPIHRENIRVILRIPSSSSTSALISVATADNSTVSNFNLTVDWSAIQMTPTSAAG